MSKSLDELGSEDFGKCTYGEEEALMSRRNEFFLIQGERASRDHAVQMRMQREILTPGVEDGGDAKPAARVG